MLLIEEIFGEVAAPEGDGASQAAPGFACWGRIPAELASEGWASSSLGIEMGAQTAALFEATSSWAEVEPGERPAGPPIGYLVGITGATFDGPLLLAERSLWVEVRRAGGMLPLARYEVTVAEASGEPALVTATISTYLVS